MNTQNTINTEITSKELIEIYKGIEIYKHPNPILSSIYNAFVINGFEYSMPCIRLAKHHITRELNKANKIK
jgi:hypothetical protein